MDHHLIAAPATEGLPMMRRWHLVNNRQKRCHRQPRRFATSFSNAARHFWRSIFPRSGTPSGRCLDISMARRFPRGQRNTESAFEIPANQLFLRSFGFTLAQKQYLNREAVDEACQRDRLENGVDRRIERRPRPWRPGFPARRTAGTWCSADFGSRSADVADRPAVERGQYQPCHPRGFR